MFERFAEAARRAVTDAAAEARRMGHGHLGTEHLLLGVLAQSQDPAAVVLGRFGLDLEGGRRAVLRRSGGSGAERDGAALASIGIDLDAVREAVESAFGPGALDGPPPTRRPRRGGPRFTAHGRGAMALALRAATGARVRRIEAGHLLLGVLREGGGTGVRLLRAEGVDLAELERALEAALVGGLPRAS
ncbi:Clp protease N-terminal domain-containing protein [Kitasatospora sp. NPDC088391]|uniref:Clp protease N-terminal domain-containing protein n=1 Tax=Kitasatospora sp. NPDC088391 TaxID=3364074 RepID=UPI0037FA572D